MSKLPVYAWYFPNWHPDPRNDEWHGKGWTEWEVSKRATPRFPGHEQPKIPVWGYEDESDPAVMEKKIDTAMKHGIDGFLWDMYWFEDGPYRLKALDQGFFGAKNNQDFQIALMWCNHDPIYVHPGSRMYTAPPLLNGDLTPQAFYNGTQHSIDNHFGRPNYMRVDGKIFFIIWHLDKLVKGFGGLYGTRMVLEDFRRRVEKAGLGKLHLACEFGNIPGARDNDRARFNQTLDACGIDEVTSYGWPMGSDHWPDVPYDTFAAAGLADYSRRTGLSDKPVNITVSTGWDSSPRTVQSEIYGQYGYPFNSIITGGTPQAFEKALAEAKKFAESGGFTGHFISLTTWNEWTEGNYLEPDEKFGYGYLEAVKRVFG